MIQQIRVKDLIEGEILAESIFDCKGKLILAKYTSINHYMISILRHHGVQAIKVIQKEDKEQLGAYESFWILKEDYKECIQMLKDVLYGLISGKSAGYKALNPIVDILLQHMDETDGILKVLEEEKRYDEYTYTHSLNVALYAMLIGKWLKLELVEIEELVIAGLLHDIGKTRVPLAILNKQGRLTEIEFKVMKGHPMDGYKILKRHDQFSNKIREAVLLHHERMDGSGYPFAHDEEQIPLFARIIAVADVYDAITTDRVYKARLTPFETFAILKTTELKNLDPAIVDVFIRCICVHYVGIEVLLNTGEVAEVVYVPPQCLTDPIIRIEDEYLDISRRRDKLIVEVV
ncbi:MAG: hypothetical protein PWP24_832 [Clostridiales bacterium]|nr:hypothetical protein [Clostridiales bacterium]